MKITDSIKYVGVNDHEVDLFEGQFEVPLGMAYNSYVILDDKICVMDSVDKNFGDVWLNNIEEILGSSKPSYIVVQHMEMDHSASLKLFMDKYPECKIVASKMAFTMMASYFGPCSPDRQVVVTEGSTLDLGNHKLTFITAPNVHWPEVIMTYDSTDKVLFSADGFGKFGANDVEDPEGWACEARRYYFGIVGKFGANVQALLKKASSLDIKIICSLHGPVLDSNIEEYVKYYNIWSNYDVETEGVVICYTSVYGNTKACAEKLKSILETKGCPKVAICDLAREDTYECIEDAFRYGKLVLASTTYCGGVFPKMREFIEHLTERNYQKRTVAFIENGSWMPAAAKAMASLFESSDVTILDTKVTMKIVMDEAVEASLEKLATELMSK